MRIVLDTSVLFAALRLETGFCSDLFRQCILHHQIVISEHILEELRRHLRVKGKLTFAKVSQVIDAIRDLAAVVTPSDVDAAACRDANDLPVLGTAIGGNATVSIRGDRVLLVLHPFRRLQSFPLDIFLNATSR